MNKMYLVLGDWSDDGHGKTDKELYSCSHTVEEVQQAYKDSCKLTGISFNHDEDYTGLNMDRVDKEQYSIATEYESREITEEVFKVLEKFNCPLCDYYKNTSSMHLDDSFEELWWWFISLSIPDIVYNKIKDEVPVINGYWNKNLNVQFGYGLYW
jgi:hypothetical protein